MKCSTCPPAPLSATDKSSFAYKTIKDRLPVIIVKTIDFLHRQRKELHRFGGTLEAPNEGQLAEIEADAKTFICELTKLRKDVETNKPVQLVNKLELEPELDYFNDDVDLWNAALEESRLPDSMPRWMESPWLLVECYLYRKVKEAALRTRHLKLFDPFIEQKQAAAKASLAQMTAVAVQLRSAESQVAKSDNRSHPSERKEFSLFLRLALWANKSDLSISGMSADKIQAQKISTNLYDMVDDLQENVLCDNSSELWFKVQSIKEAVRNSSKSATIDLIADNSGYEIFVDLCLLHFLQLMLAGDTNNENVTIRVHVKRMPWFVSDTLTQDVDWLLKYMSSLEQNEPLQALAKQWRSLIDSGRWQIKEHRFWTLPHDYARMASVSPDLYSALQQSSLIISKGDLNYRKLTGDLKWHILTPFRVALREFEPAPLVALRTAKADVVVGIEDINIFAKINNNELPRDWNISGDYGLIQYLDPQ